MLKNYVGMQYEKFREKYNEYFVHRKKLRALENYSSVQYFEGSKYIRIIKELLNDGFLDDQEEKFLDHQIQKVEIDAFTWCHKTTWVKNQMRTMSMAHRKRTSQLYFDFEKAKSQYNGHVPLHLLNNMNNKNGARVS